MHEFRAPPATAGHLAFAVLRLAALPSQIPILWVSLTTSLYPPGLAWLGLDPPRCLFARAKDDAESLGTLEVALRGGMAGAAESINLTRLAAKRLALAAKQGGGIGFVLRHAAASTPADSTAFATRWLITPVPSKQCGWPRLKAQLLYAKGSRPGVFFYDIREAENGAPPTLTLVGERQEIATKEHRAG